MQQTLNAGDFTPQASSYALARPGYPPAMIQRLIARTRAAPGQPVADLAAGTGIFSRLLAQSFLRVTAVEPSEAMRRAADDCRGVTWSDGRFDDLPLPDASQCWVTVAQAFHWADPTTALPQFHRVLKPGGHVTILWNRMLEDDPIVAWTRKAIRRHVPDQQPPRYERHRDWSAVLTGTGHFTEVVQDHVAHVVPMDRRRFLDLWRSHNLLNVQAGPQRFQAFVCDLERYLDEQGVRIIGVPYRCMAWTARRMDR